MRKILLAIMRLSVVRKFVVCMQHWFHLPYPQAFSLQSLISAIFKKRYAAIGRILAPSAREKTQ